MVQISKKMIKRKSQFFIQRYGSIVVVLFLLGGFTSCDLFFIGPMGRYNRDDDKLSLLRFDAYPYGDGQMFVGWNWLDQERQIRNDIDIPDPQWDKIVIKSRKNTRPTSRLGGTEISVKDNQWYKIFSDLDYDHEHYFAVWPHEKGGKWLSPIFINRNVEYPKTAGPRTSTLVDVFSFNTVSGDYNSQSLPITVDDVDIWYIFYFDNTDSNVVVKSAQLTLDIDDTTSSGTLIINPVRWDDGEFFASILNLDKRTFERQKATETFISKTISAADAIAGPQEFDITEIFSRALYHGPGFLVLRASSGSSIDILAGTNPTITYEGVWRW